MEEVVWGGEKRRTHFVWLRYWPLVSQHCQTAPFRSCVHARISGFAGKRFHFSPPSPPSFRFLLSFQLSQQTYAETLATQFNRASSHWLIRGHIDDIVQRNSFPPNVFRQQQFLLSFAMLFFLFVLGTARVPSWSLFPTSDQISVWQ